MADKDRLLTDRASIAAAQKFAFYKKAFFLMNILCIFAHICYTVVFSFTAVIPLCIFNILSAAFYIGMLYAVRDGRYIFAGTSICVEIIVHVILATILLGWNFGFTCQLFAIVAVSFFIPYKKFYQCCITSVCSVTAFFFLWFYTRSASPLISSVAVTNAQGFLYIFNCCVTIAPLFIESYMYRITSEKSETILFERNKDLLVLASVDPLTNLLNRRSMEIKLENAYNRRELVFDPFCVVIGDIDDFKSINDTYGHDCGDYVLKTISDIFAASLRSNDNVSRWGGEEILILLNSTDVGCAIQTMERIREEIAKYDFCYNDEHFTVTMTFGLSWRREYIENMLLEADEHLYTGKQNGKNQIVYDKPSP